MKRLTLLSALSACVVLSCTGHHEVPAPDKKTDWLGLCGHSSECRAGLACIEGLCTTRCKHANDCSRHAKDAICVAPSAAATCPSGSPLDVGRMCTLPCEARRQCAGPNPALWCVAGACQTETCTGSLIDAGMRDAAMMMDGTGDSGGTRDAAIQPVDASIPDVDASTSDAARGPGGGTGGASVPADSGSSTGGEVIEAALPVRVLVADQVRHRVYAIAGSEASTYASELITFDPAQPDLLLHHVAVGSDPSALAISDDASTLWVGLSGTNSVRKVDLSSGTPVPGASYAVDPDNSSVKAQWIRALPGRPNSIAIAMSQDGASAQGAIILDDGVPRSARINYGVAGGLAAGPSGQLFGLDNGYYFYSLTADTSGLVVSNGGTGLIQGIPTDLAYDPDGFVYATSGEIVDVRAPGNLKRAGVFPYSGAIWPLPSSDITLMVSLRDEISGPLVLRTLDSSTYTQLSSRIIGDPNGYFEYVKQAVLVGSDSLVVLAGTGPATAVGSSMYALNEPGLGDAPPSAQASVVPIARGNLTEVPLKALTLTADPQRQRLYATTDERAGALPNRLVTIDATSGQLLHDVPIGSEPTAVALADDASTLWVGLRGSFEIRAVSLNAANFPSAGSRYVLPPQYTDHMGAAASLVVLPGTAASVAAALEFTDGSSPITAGFVVLDNGASRANASVGYIDTSALALGPDGVLFGWDVYDGFHTLELGGTGTTIAQTPLGVVLGSGSNNDAQIVYDPDDFVYASSGEVVDVTDPTAPKRNGVFPFSGAVWPVPSSDLVLMVSAGEDGSGPLVLRALDTATSTQIEARSLGNPTDTFEFVSNLAVIPPDTLAFIAGSSGDRGSSVYLFHDSSLLTPSPPSATTVLPVDRAGLAEFEIDAQALVADPSKQRIYVSVGDRDPVYPNRLLTIDAVQPAVVASASVGSRPTTLALSDDGSTLWVNLHGSDELCKVNIGNGTATPIRNDRLPLGSTGSLADATSMVVLSGTTSSLMTALALGEPGSVSFLGLKVVDDGTARPGVIYSELISQVIRGPQGYVFGYDDMSTGEAFYTLVVDGSGAVVKYQGGPFVTGFSTDIVYDSDGYVYASSGEIVDVSNPEAPSSAGAFSYSGAVWPVPSSDDVLMVSIAPEGNLVLRKLDTVTQMQLSATAIGDPNAAYTSVSHLVHAAPGVLAFIAQPTSNAQSRLYVLSDPDLIP